MNNAKRLHGFYFHQEKFKNYLITQYKNHQNINILIFYY